MGAVPVQRFSPVPSIFLDRTGKHVDITGRMEMSGDEATMVRAASVQHHINNTWTQSFDDGYSCKCNITVRYLAPGVSPTPSTFQIYAKKQAGPSNVYGVFTKAMELNASEKDTFTWTCAHEFGHVLGLEDKYVEGLISSIKGQFGGERTATVQPGYEGNLMAKTGGKFSGKNIADLIAEDEPSDFDDDDQIRLWIIAHTRAQLSHVPDRDKLKMIEVLQSGWFSNDDLWAVKQICDSVLTQRGAEMIRNGIDLDDFNNSAQRAEVQAAFNRMPQ
jgi:hypothetical protein